MNACLSAVLQLVGEVPCTKARQLYKYSTHEPEMCQ